MKVFCDRGEMLDAFTSVASCVPTRSPKPVLMGVKMVVGEEACEIMATDLEVGIRHRLDRVTVDQPGSVVLPASQFESILRTSKDEQIDLSVKDGVTLVVKTSSSRFAISTDDPESFPDVPVWDDGPCYAIKAGDLRKLIRRTYYATDPTSTRFALGGVLVEFGDESATMVATDGRRLSRMVVPAEAEGNPTAEGSPVIPVKALRLIEKNLPGDEFPVHIVIRDGKSLFVRTEDAVIYSRLVEGRFPRYQDVFPAAPEITVPMKCGILRSAVEQAAIVTSRESKGVDFQFDEDLLTISGTTADIGESHVKIPVEFKGLPNKVSINADFVLEAMKPIDGDTRIFAEVIDAGSPVVFKTDDGFTGLIMPLSKDR